MRVTPFPIRVPKHRWRAWASPPPRLVRAKSIHPSSRKAGKARMPVNQALFPAAAAVQPGRARTAGERRAAKSST